MRTKLEVLELFRMETRVKPKMELTLHELNIRHQELIRAWRAARDVSNALNSASMAASRSTQYAYGALASFEADLEFFQEKASLEGMERFDLVTIEKDDQDGGEEHA